MEIPLFLLNAVLHSGGSLSLRVFEARYMDMVKDCLRTQTSFGVCLLEQGAEILAPAVPSREKIVPRRVGTLATIADWDKPQMGIDRKSVV